MSYAKIEYSEADIEYAAEHGCFPQYTTGYQFNWPLGAIPTFKEIEVKPDYEITHQPHSQKLKVRKLIKDDTQRV